MRVGVRVGVRAGVRAGVRVRGTSSRGSWRMWSMVSMEGERPPCTERSSFSTSAESGR